MSGYHDRFIKVCLLSSNQVYANAHAYIVTCYLFVSYFCSVIEMLGIVSQSSDGRKKNNLPLLFLICCLTSSLHVECTSDMHVKGLHNVWSVHLHTY